MQEPHTRSDPVMAEVGAALKAARERLGLSQREVGRRAGLPQAHLSKIERGAVDLRISSLVALARILELEPTLVPRRLHPAVRALIAGSRQAGAAEPALRPAYSLDDEDE